jgi:16S rRNA processing protein RimM
VSSPRSELILVATIGAAHGVRGEVRVKSFTADPMALSGYTPLTTEDGRVFEIERLRPAKNVLIAKFRGIDDRDAAEQLNGLSLCVPREALPPPEAGEFYHTDLIGLYAVDRDGVTLGIVIAVHDFGAGDILDIKPTDGPSVLIPFTREAVPDVDIAGKRIIVAPPLFAADETESQDKP